MTDSAVLERYRELAVASLEQGINDFLSGEDSLEDFLEWTGESIMFDYLDIDRVWVVEKVLELKARGKIKIGGVTKYAKKSIY